MPGYDRLVRGALVVLSLACSARDGQAQRTIAAGVAAGYAAGVDASGQLHGAALIGNDYAGGAGYGAFAVGMTYR